MGKEQSDIGLYLILSFLMSVRVYPCFDAAKWVLSYVVISIHCGVLTEITPPVLHRAVFLLQTMAVPLFFAMSGFLVARKWDTFVKSRMGDVLRRQWRLYVLWSVVYLPVNLWGEWKVYQHEGMDILDSLLQGWLLVGQNYDSWPLWYLLASLIGTFLIWSLARLGMSKRTIVVGAFVTYVVGLILVRWNQDGVLAMLRSWMEYVHGNRNGLFMGWACLSVGLLPAFRLKRVWLLLAAVLLIGIGLWKAFVVVLPLSYVLTQWLQTGRAMGYGQVYRWMRQVSTLNYFVHMLLVFLLSEFLPTQWHGARLFAWVAVATTCISCFLLLLSRRYGWLRTLF